MKLPLNLLDLRQQFEAGNTFEFTFFWGHTPPKDGSISKSCFSQWFELGFEIDGVHYSLNIAQSGSWRRVIILMAPTALSGESQRSKTID